MTQVEVELETIITLPEWSPPESADPELVAAWDRFLEALTLHEEGHKTNGEEAAREARRELRRVTAPACSLIERGVNDRGHEIIDKYQRRNAEYDEETARGMSQGAVWPPRRSWG